ncbi:glycosyltransferase [Thermococcus sp. MV11]|uniref:glycosyltransferase n=1 Tax=Thermococcus sp. MV11 TaxID=1638267 RepID=UPI001431F6B4|nr:glycosyltransferase [Thermococcus sp. MV11]NJE03842.1 glycosyltransferase [Thermococcus sp. MV11]
MKRTVVVMSYYFPPYPAVGGLRVRGIARYLPKYGWNVIVITPNLGIQPDEEFNIVQVEKQSTLLNLTKRRSNSTPLRSGTSKIKDIPRHITRLISQNDTLSSLILDLIMFIDYIRLRREFLKTFDELYKKQEINAIISTSPPEVTHMIAHEISQKYDIPWIAEYRDLWSLNLHPRWRRTRIGRLISQAIELKSTQYAHSIVVVDEVFKKDERSLIKDKPIVIIKNGFDPRDVPSVPKEKREQDKFIITYTGSFYKSKRNPLPMAYAIDELVQTKALPKEKIQLNLFGPNLAEETLKILREFEFVNTGVLPREEARRWQMDSNVLLLLLAEEDYQAIPAKLFEYLSVGKPILAVGPIENKMIEEILNKTGLGIFVTSGDKEALKDAIVSLYYHKIKIKPRKDVIEKYSQIEMARKISRMLDKIIHTSGGGNKG